MKNWAGNLTFHPTRVLAPASTEEAHQMIQTELASKRNLRMRGSAHSWTGLISTQESFIHLDNMQGLLEVDTQGLLIRALAGTKLKRFGEEAFKHQLGFPNQGDINHQSLAGALSTGTHGTGLSLQSMPNQLSLVKLVTGEGDLIEVSGEKLKALAISLGSLGLITETTLRMTPAYKLKVESFAEDMDVSLREFQQRLNQNRHLEMFYFPMGNWSMVKMMNETQGTAAPDSKLTQLTDLVLENWFYEALNILAGKTNCYKSIDKFMRLFVSKKTKTDWSHRAFPTERSVRFMEMEYNLPIEKFEEVFQEMKSIIKQRGFQTLFPIEIRFVKGDELWLSPAYQRDSVYFAIHTYIDQNFRPYFEAMQELFLRHGGRPHWGKWHSATHDQLERMYPKWQEFKNLRQELDPKGVWLNEHLKNLFCPS